MNSETTALYARLNVLIVDDDREIRNLIEMILRELGVEKIATVNDGQDAQEYLEDEASRVDLIICDWKMPRMDGLEFLRLVRKTHPDMPFMMVTGVAELDLVESAKNSGVNAVIAKPFSRSQIHEKMRILAAQIAGGQSQKSAAPAEAPEDETEDAAECAPDDAPEVETPN